MYDFFFNPDVFTISLTIYVLAAAIVVLSLKLHRAERKHQKNVEYIVFLHERLMKLEKAKVWEDM